MEKNTLNIFIKKKIPRHSTKKWMESGLTEFYGTVKESNYISSSNLPLLGTNGEAQLFAF